METMHKLAWQRKTLSYPQYVQWGDTEIVALCNSKDSAHIVAKFDTLPSATKLLFIHKILGTKSLLG